MADGSLMRNLGSFVGHVWKGIRTDPTAPARTTEVRREIDETEDGTVILRRTTVEEIEMKKKLDDD